MHSWKHSQDWWAKMFVFIFVCFNASLSFMPRIMKKKWYTCSSLFHRKDRTAFQKLRRKSGEVVFFEGKTIREVCCHCCGPKSFVFLDKINQYFYCTHCWLILTTLVLQISWSFFFFFWGGEFCYTCSSLFHRKDTTAYQKLRRKSGEAVFF